MEYPLRRFALVGLGCYCLLVLYGTLQPFNFAWDARLHASPQTYRNPEWIPFTRVGPTHHYVWQIEDKLINLLMLIPFGALVGASLPPVCPLRRQLWMAGMSSLVFSLGVETAQYFLPGRLPAATDVFLNTCSGVLGGGLGFFAAGWWVDRGRLFSTKKQTAIEFDGN